MANVITSVVTEDALKFLPQMWGGLITTQSPISFKIGEGGFIDEGSGPIPRTPVSTLRRLDNNIQDLDALVDPTRPVDSQRYASDEIFVYEKSFVSTDITFQSPSTLRLRCFLDLGEANDDGFGNDPEFWEIGIFTDHPDFLGTEKLMIAYGTFPQEVKNGTRRLENIVLVTMAGV